MKRIDRKIPLEGERTTEGIWVRRRQGQRRGELNIWVDLMAYPANAPHWPPANRQEVDALPRHCHYTACV